MTDLAYATVETMTDAAVKFTALAIVAELTTRRIIRVRPAIAHRIWLVVIATAALLPAFALLTPPSILVEPSGRLATVATSALGSRGGVLSITTLCCSGVAFGLLRLLAGLMSIRRLRRTCRAVSEGDARELRRLTAMRSRRGSRCEFLESPALAVPVTAGQWPPCILLPDGWREWPAGRLCAVLAHEGAHVDRADYLKGILVAAFRTLWWWHPASWIAASRVRLTAEIACDERGARAHGAADYAAHLLDLAKASGGRQLRYAWTLGATSSLSARVDALLTAGRADHSRLPAGFRLAVVIVAAAGTCAATQVRFTAVTRAETNDSISFETASDHRAAHALRHGAH